MKKLQLLLRLVAVLSFFLVVIFFASPQTRAQEVVAVYPDGAGSIVKYRVSDGSEISRIQQLYRLGNTIYKPSKIAVDSSAYYVVFGDRFLARLRASDGAILWVVDAGLSIGITTYFVADIAVAGGNVFLCNYDPGRRIAKFRVSDGALVWSIQYGIQEGWVRQLPVKLAAVGSDSFFALVGYKFLTKIRQSDGAVLFQVNIAVTSFLTTWNFGDLTVGGGFEYTSNLDPLGTVRKFDDSGALVWQRSQLYRVGFFWYLPTKLAAVGSDPVMVLFGDRYLARMRAIDGQILWTKDIGLPTGYTPTVPTDIAAIGAP